MASEREIVLVRLLAHSMEREAPEERIEVKPSHCEGLRCLHKSDVENENPDAETDDCGCSCRDCVAVITQARIERDDQETIFAEREVSTALQRRVENLTKRNQELEKALECAQRERVDTVERYELKIDTVIKERDATRKECEHLRASSKEGF